MVQVIIVAGFLGSGKTTLVTHAAQRLQAQGLRVGVITNDQAGDLVDTAVVNAAHVPVVEVVGGCFCCRFPDLWRAVTTLLETVAPDVIFAEPVGSCTDLAATLIRPLRAYHASTVTVAPLTVLVDPTREWRSAPLAAQYLHQQQLREAELVLVSKADLLPPAQVRQVTHRWQTAAPQAPVRLLAASDGAAVDAWLAQVRTTHSEALVLRDIDYAEYAAAEAALGWLNATMRVHATRPFSLAAWLPAAALQWAQLCTQHDAWIAHVKVAVESAAGLAKVSLMADGRPPHWDVWPGEHMVDVAHVVINARVALPPEQLAAVFVAWQAALPAWMTAEVVHQEVFAPAPPQPTFRFDAITPTSSEESRWPNQL